MQLPSIAPDTFTEIWPGAKPPEITVLMPIYRQPQFIETAVRSVLRQRMVACEIIISDDASGDGTFEAALATVHHWLAQRGSDHRIVVRQGSERLWRDHLPLLADSATCDWLCQAHGDDESHPDRAQVLMTVARAQPSATMLTSEAISMDAEGRSPAVPRPLQPQLALSRYTFERIIAQGHNHLIGYAQAWRRSAVSRFPRLDRAFAATSHDRILPFRAALAGDVYLIKAQLVKRRLHPEAAHNLMFDEDDAGGNFGWTLSRLTALAAMKSDLQRGREIGLLDATAALPVATLLDQALAQATRDLVEAHRLNTRAGRQIAWVDEATIRRLRQQRLAAAAAPAPRS